MGIEQLEFEILRKMKSITNRLIQTECGENDMAEPESSHLWAFESLPYSFILRVHGECLFFLFRKSVPMYMPLKLLSLRGKPYGYLSQDGKIGIVENAAKLLKVKVNMRDLTVVFFFFTLESSQVFQVHLTSFLNFSSRL